MTLVVGTVGRQGHRHKWVMGTDGQVPETLGRSPLSTQGRNTARKIEYKISEERAGLAQAAAPSLSVKNVSGCWGQACLGSRPEQCSNLS